MIPYYNIGPIVATKLSKDLSLEVGNVFTLEDNVKGIKVEPRLDQEEEVRNLKNSMGLNLVG